MVYRLFTCILSFVAAMAFLAGCDNSIGGQFTNASLAGSVDFNGIDSGDTSGTLLDINGYISPDIEDFEKSSSFANSTGLIGLWSLNENPSNGSTISDMSNNNMNGQFYTALSGTHGVNGHLLGGVDFDGSSSGVLIPDTTAADNLSAMTITAWIYPRTQGNGNEGTILSKCQASVVCDLLASVTQGWSFGFSSAGTGRLNFVQRGPTGVISVTSEHGGITTNTWNFVAISYDGSHTFAGANFYRNGTLLLHANQSGDGPASNPSDAGSDIIIGDDPYGSTFDGVIDSVTLWNRALSQTEIQQIYQTQTNNYQSIYDSQIFDSASMITEWQSLQPILSHPMGKPLSTSSETQYVAGNFNNNGLVAYFDLNGTLSQSASTTANAVVGQGPLSLTATAVDTDSSLIYQEGQQNQALSFDGVEDHIVLENSASLDITGNEITLMAWTKAATTCCDSNGSRIISKRTDSLGADVYALLLGGANEAEFRLDATMNTVNVTDFVDNQGWMHLAGVYNGTDMRVYINGKLHGNPVARTGTIASSSQPVHIGMRQAEDRLFDGMIDEVAIFNRALSAEEVYYTYKRSAQKIRFQVRSCSEPTCTGVSFVGPDGTTSSYYSDEDRRDPSTPLYELNIANNRYFQYRAYFDFNDYSDINSALRDVIIKANRP